MTCRRTLAHRALLPLSVAALAWSGACGGSPSELVTAPPKSAESARGDAASGGGGVAGGVTLPRARILMDAPAAATFVAERAGKRLHLDARVRIALSSDGRVERARALLPRGQVKALELPARFGGRWLFTVVGGTGSQVFAADTWTSELAPLVSTASVVDIEDPIVPGFDRLYVRLKSQNLLLPIDPTTGASLAQGPLPQASAYGAMVFVDGWRAVVDADLRGLLATFDAGATWKPLPPLDGVQKLGEIDGDPVIFAASGAWALRGDGRLALATVDQPTASPPVRRESDDAFDDRPLRAAIEDGWPDGAGTAVVARKGSLARVSLADGRVLLRDDDAFPEAEASCHAMPLGRGIGFACGEPDAGTVIYQLVRGVAGDDSIAMREAMRWADARRVVPSGNGAAIVSGSCAADVVDPEAFCVRAVDGSSREIRLRGGTASPRLVALADGRVAIVVAPTADLAGQLTLLAGDSPTHIPLVFKAAAEKSFGKSTRKAEGGKAKPPHSKEPKKPDLRDGLDPIVRGTWLDGMQEVEPNVIAGWIEGGGPVAGVRITLDGKVELGEVVEEDAALVAGPFGLAFDAGGRAVETTDFGRTWAERELTPVDMRIRDVPRGCGPAGCALPNLLRVGWGEPAVKDDLAVAPEPSPAAVPIDKLAQKPLSLSCDVVSGPHGGIRPGKPAAPKPPPPKPNVPVRTPIPPAARRPAPAPTATALPAESPTPNGWQALRGAPGPALAAGETGFDGGQPFEQVAMRAYAWGNRGSWGRTARWLVRFDDRFDPLGLRSTRPTTTPWTQDSSAGEAFGTGAFSYAVTWGASLEPEGRLALASGCAGRVCALYLAGDEAAVIPLRDAEGLGFARPIGPPVQIGQTTWFLSQSGVVSPTPPGNILDPIYINRADGAVVTRVGVLRRPGPPRFAPPQPVRLVRRAQREGLGLLTTTFAGPNDRRGRLVVVPIDPSSGAFGDPIALGRADLADRDARPCGPADDGWLLEVSWDRPPAIVDLGNARPPPARPSVGATKRPTQAPTLSQARVSGVEARVRVDATSMCVESMAAATDGPLAIKGGATQGASIPMAVTHRGTSERWGLRCVAKP